MWCQQTAPQVTELGPLSARVSTLYTDLSEAHKSTATLATCYQELTQQDQHSTLRALDSDKFSPAAVSALNSQISIIEKAVRRRQRRHS